MSFKSLRLPEINSARLNAFRRRSFIETRLHEVGINAAWITFFCSRSRLCGGEIVRSSLYALCEWNRSKLSKISGLISQRTCRGKPCGHKHRLVIPSPRLTRMQQRRRSSQHVREKESGATAPSNGDFIGITPSAWHASALRAKCQRSGPSLFAEARPAPPASSPAGCDDASATSRPSRGSHQDQGPSR